MTTPWRSVQDAGKANETSDDWNFGKNRKRAINDAFLTVFPRNQLFDDRFPVPGKRRVRRNEQDSAAELNWRRRI